MSKAETAGQRLQRLRQAAGLSQSQLATAADVPIGTLRNWEQDRRAPLLDTAARVSQAIGVSLDELAGTAGPERPPKPPPSTAPGAELEMKGPPRRGRKGK
jgi:transcriptional regulator with XRE-family HTH domain